MRLMPTSANGRRRMLLARKNLRRAPREPPLTVAAAIGGGDCFEADSCLRSG